jgi:hypothetical protein
VAVCCTLACDHPLATFADGGHFPAQSRTGNSNGSAQQGSGRCIGTSLVFDLTGSIEFQLAATFAPELPRPHSAGMPFLVARERRAVIPFR